MKRILVILTLGLVAFLVIGADRPNAEVPKVTKKVCRGYTIIADSKGIDCNGDTLQLVRVAGFYQRVP